MAAILDRILTFNLIGTTIVFYMAARIYLLPNLGRWRASTVLVPILLLHALRQLGLMFLTRGATYPGLPPQFIWPAALGDFITAVLAFVSIFAVLRDSPIARPMVWTFNIFGTLDLVNAIALATLFDVAPHMGPAYWIPAFWVPSLLVTHYITFVILLSYWPRQPRNARQSSDEAISQYQLH